MGIFIGILENEGEVVGGIQDIAYESGTLYLKKGEAAKGAGFIWEERNKTLTITDEGLEINATGEAGLCVPIDTKIILNGDLTINAMGDLQNGVVCGAGLGNLKISGTGKLTICCTGYGIYIPNGNIEIADVSIDIAIHSKQKFPVSGIYSGDGDIKITNAHVAIRVESDESIFVVYAGKNISLLDGKMQILAKNGRHYGIAAGNTISMVDVSVSDQSHRGILANSNIIMGGLAKVRANDIQTYGVLEIRDAACVYANQCKLIANMCKLIANMCISAIAEVQGMVYNEKEVKEGIWEYTYRVYGDMTISKDQYDFWGSTLAFAEGSKLTVDVDVNIDLSNCNIDWTHANIVNHGVIQFANMNDVDFDAITGGGRITKTNTMM